MNGHASYLRTKKGSEFSVGPVNDDRWCFDIMWFGGLWNCCTRSGVYRYYAEEVETFTLETD